MAGATGQQDEKTIPLRQKQEDLLLHLFLRLETEDRVKVIKMCRDLLRESRGTEE